MSCQETIVMNTENFAVTEYTNYPFNSFCVFNGKFLGAKADGIFELTGSNDAGTPINGSVEVPPIDAGKGQPRIPRDAWIAGRKAAMTLGVKTNEGTTYTYNAPEVSTKATEERVKIGRGIVGRYFSFILTNLNGVSFDIDSIRVLVEPLRRVR